jgi:hypothetical protein
MVCSADGAQQPSGQPLLDKHPGAVALHRVDDSAAPLASDLAPLNEQAGQPSVAVGYRAMPDWWSPGDLLALAAGDASDIGPYSPRRFIAPAMR